jgi:uncharacterized protein YbaA (DUF1428 family)
MSYVDGFVAAVPSDGREAYLRYAATAAALFREFGALRVVECWGDEVPEGEVTSFPMAVKAGPGETVVFSWVAWPSKEVRDAAWERFMTEPRMNPETNPMPFDGRRMIYGGFTTLLDH